VGGRAGCSLLVWRQYTNPKPLAKKDKNFGQIALKRQSYPLPSLPQRYSSFKLLLKSRMGRYKNRKTTGNKTCKS
jgi:hypothetical protein